VIDHVRWSTQPLDEPPDPAHLAALLDMIRAGRPRRVSTDYPHWDNEFPERALSRIEGGLKRRILYENALETFERLGPDVADACAAVPVAAARG
jgi:hypothetical protein